MEESPRGGGGGIRADARTCGVPSDDLLMRGCRQKRKASCFEATYSRRGRCVRARICDVDARRRNAARRATLHGTPFIREAFADRGETCKSAATVAALTPLTSLSPGPPCHVAQVYHHGKYEPVQRRASERAAKTASVRPDSVRVSAAGRDAVGSNRGRPPLPSFYSSREQKHRDPPPLHENAAVARTDSLIVFRRWYYEAASPPLL